MCGLGNLDLTHAYSVTMTPSLLPAILGTGLCPRIGLLCAASARVIPDSPNNSLLDFSSNSEKIFNNSNDAIPRDDHAANNRGTKDDKLQSCGQA